MSTGALPNLIVIGAQKAGTTLLHGLLDVQPGVAMSKPKELDFFSSERGDAWRRGIGWYREQFDPQAAVRGESSPGYAAHPFAEAVPERIASVIDPNEVRFVYLVRDPVDRVVSALRHAIGTGEERRSAAAVLDGELEGTAYLAMSRYAMQLQRYHDVFGPDAVLVVDFDELISDPLRVVGRALAHCGHRIEPIAAGSAEANPAASWPVRRALRRVLPERAVRALLRAQPLPRLDRRLMRPAPPIELSAGQRSRLQGLVADDVTRLRQLTGLALSGWRSAP